MKNLRTLALLALLPALPHPARANTITLSPNAFSPATLSSATAQFGTPLFDGSTSTQSGFTFPRYVTAAPQAPSGSYLSFSAPNPFADTTRSTRPFAVTANSLQPYHAPPEAQASALAPEPAGLFLLGTGAFATALSIRWRLFAL